MYNFNPILHCSKVLESKKPLYEILCNGNIVVSVYNLEDAIRLTDNFNKCFPGYKYTYQQIK